MNNKNMKLKYKNIWLFIGLCMVIFVIKSSLESDPLSLDMGFEMQDKILHVTGYFGLMGWFMQIYQQRKACYLLAFIFVSMGISLEYLQDFGGVRYFEVSDMLANSLGVFLAWSLVKTPFPRILFWFEAKLAG
jgi:VanZ family protein